MVLWEPYAVKFEFYGPRQFFPMRRIIHYIEFQTWWNEAHQTLFIKVIDYSDVYWWRRVSCDLGWFWSANLKKLLCVKNPNQFSNFELRLYGIYTFMLEFRSLKPMKKLDKLILGSFLGPFLLNIPCGRFYSCWRSTCPKYFGWDFLEKAWLLDFIWADQLLVNLHFPKALPLGMCYFPAWWLLGNLGEHFWANCD